MFRESAHNIDHISNYIELIKNKEQLDPEVLSMMTVYNEPVLFRIIRRLTNKTDMLYLLSIEKLDVNVKGSMGESVLDVLAQMDYYNKEVYDFLKNKNEGLFKSVDRNGTHPLHRTVNVNILRYYIDIDSDLLNVTNENNDRIYLKIEMDPKILLACSDYDNFEINYKDGEGRNIAHYIVQNKEFYTLDGYECYVKLLSLGLDIESKDVYGISVIKHIWQGYYEDNEYISLFYCATLKHINQFTQEDKEDILYTVYTNSENRRYKVIYYLIKYHYYVIQMFMRNNDMNELIHVLICNESFEMNAIEKEYFYYSVKKILHKNRMLLFKPNTKMTSVLTKAMDRRKVEFIKYVFILFPNTELDSDSRKRYYNDLINKYHLPKYSWEIRRIYKDMSDKVLEVIYSFLPGKNYLLHKLKNCFLGTDVVHDILQLLKANEK